MMDGGGGTHASFREMEASLSLERVFSALRSASNMSSPNPAVAEAARDEHAWLLSLQRSPSFWSFAVRSTNQAVLNLETQRALRADDRNIEAADALLFFAASTAARRIQSEWDALDDATQVSLLTVPTTLLCNVHLLRTSHQGTEEAGAVPPWLKMLAVVCADAFIFASSVPERDQIIKDALQSLFSLGEETSPQRFVFLRMLSEEEESIAAKFNTMGARTKANRASLLISRTVEPMLSLGVPLLTRMASGQESAGDVHKLCLFLDCFDAFAQASQGPGIAVNTLLKVPMLSSIMTILDKTITSIQQTQHHQILQTSLHVAARCFVTVRNTMCGPKQQRSFRSNPSTVNEGFSAILTSWQKVWSLCNQHSTIIQQQALLHLLKEASTTLMSLAESFFEQLKLEHQSASFQIAQMLADSGSFELSETCFPFFAEISSLKEEDSKAVMPQLELIQRLGLTFLLTIINKNLRPALGIPSTDSSSLTERLEDVVLAVHRLAGTEALLSLLHSINAGGGNLLSAEIILVILNIVAPDCNKSNRVVIARAVLEPLLAVPLDQISSRFLGQIIQCIGNYRSALPDVPGVFSNSMRIIAACLTSNQLTSVHSISASEAFSRIVRDKRCLQVLGSQSDVMQMCQRLHSSISMLPLVAQQQLIFSLCRIANASSSQEGRSIVMNLSCALVTALDSCATSFQAGRVISALSEVAASFGAAREGAFALLSEFHAYVWPHIVGIIRKLGPAALVEGSGTDVADVASASVRGDIDDDEDDEEEFDVGGGGGVLSQVSAKPASVDCVESTAHLMRMEFLSVPMENIPSFVPVMQQMMELFTLCPRSCILVSLAVCLSMIPETVLAPSTPSAKPFIDFFDRTARWFSGRCPEQTSPPAGSAGLVQAYSDLLVQYVRRHPVMLFTCCSESCTVFDLSLAFLKNRDVRQHVNALCSVFSFLSSYITAAPPASACTSHIRTDSGGHALLDELLQCLRSTVLPESAVVKAAAVVQALVERHGDLCSVWFQDIFRGIFAQFRERFMAASGHGSNGFIEATTSFIRLFSKADVGARSPTSSATVM